MKSKMYQKGHAALLFTLTIPFLFGIFNLGVEGARAIQTKSRLIDATEAAGLAVSAYNDSLQNSQNPGEASERNREIISGYIDLYLRNTDSVKGVSVFKRSCEQISDCQIGLMKGEQRFFEHQLIVEVDQRPWFPSLFGFGDTYKVRGDSLIRKYQATPVDVMLVTDFSGSMSETWANGSSNLPKFIQLKEIVRNITGELKKFNSRMENVGAASTVGVVPFNYGAVFGISDGSECLLASIKDANISGSIANIWKDKDRSYCVENGISYLGAFRPVPLTDDFDLLNRVIDDYVPKGGTLSYNGMILGGRLLRQGDNSRRLLILLTDGQDNYASTSNSVYVTHNLCRKLELGLESDFTRSNRKIDAKIAVIGFDMQNSSVPGALQHCAGQHNYFHANNANQIQNRILELISEEVGHLK